VPEIYINGKPYEADGQSNLLQQCLSLGFNLPYFCWHPALGSVGSCRQCAVTQYRNENDHKGSIVMACMTPVEDGMRIAIDDAESRAFRSRVIEWLMTSHPHDCPVCDEGGECHLQDMTVMTGHTYRQYRFNKRTFNNQNLGPFINHEMNRCITCYRCVRFYHDYSGGKDLQPFASRNHVFFGRHQDGALENPFSGNLVEVCPTGVFTDKTLKKHYTRKWDLQSAPSVCVHCAAGCNTIAGERYGSLRRILNRYNSQVNGYFICDRGRFGYEFVNSGQRVSHACSRGSDTEPKPISKTAALESLVNSANDLIIGIGSPRASLESNFALRTLVGEENFYAGITDSESQLMQRIIDVLQHGPAPTPTLTEIEQSDAVLILGEDISNTAPRIALACRQAVRQKAFAYADQLGIPRWMDGSVRDAAGDYRSDLFVATPDATSLDDIASALRLAPVEIARLGFAIAHAIDSNAPAVDGLAPAMQEIANAIAAGLQQAARPLIISGTGCADVSIINAAANVVKALSSNRNTRLYYTVAECNSMGLALLNPKPLMEAFATVKHADRTVTAIVLENDLYRRAPSNDARAFFNAVKRLVSIDHLQHPTVKQANLVLPAGTFAESTGTMVSAEGRMQRFFAAMQPGDHAAAGWRWISDMFPFTKLTNGPRWHHYQDVVSHCARDIQALRSIVNVAPPSDYRVDGLKIPRESHRYSGRTSMHAKENVHEPRPPQDDDSPLSYSMEGLPDRPPPALTTRYWAPGWNSVQACNKYQSEVGGALRGGDPGVRIFTADNSLVDYFSQIPGAFQRQGNSHWLLVPLHHVFGEEELSAHAQAIEARVPQPYVALNDKDALAAHIEDGDDVVVFVDGQTYRLPCQTKAALPFGVAGLPIGLRDLNGIMLPAWGTIQSHMTQGKRYG
jgi:NADH-quinone oxidoreductase subunit G